MFFLGSVSLQSPACYLSSWPSLAVCLRVVSELDMGPGAAARLNLSVFVVGTYGPFFRLMEFHVVDALDQPQFSSSCATTHGTSGSFGVPWEPRQYSLVETASMGHVNFSGITM